MKTLSTLFVLFLALASSTIVKAGTTYTVSSNSNWSSILPSTCANCTIKVSTGITLTVDKSVTCQNCVFQGGTLSMNGFSMNIQYASSLTTTYFKGTNFLVYGNGSVVVNAPLSISNASFTFYNTSALQTSYQVDLDATRINLYDNSTMVSTGGSSTLINLMNSSRIVIGSGTKTSSSSLLVSGPTLVEYDNSTIVMGNENNSYSNWANYTYSPNVNANSHANKSYSTTNTTLNCGAGHAHACSNPALYGPTTLSAAGPVSGTTLPIVLVGFSANLNNDKTVSLSWDTKEETNSSRFAVERSQDGNNWQEIGTVKAQGNAAVQTDYSFTDEHPAGGINYYRLKMMDLDGRYGYTEIKIVRSSLSATVSFFPNPAHDYVNVSLGSGMNTELTIRLINQAGQVLQEKKLDAGSATTVSFPIQQYNTGLYILSIAGADGSRQSSKLLINHL